MDLHNGSWTAGPIAMRAAAGDQAVNRAWTPPDRSHDTYRRTPPMNPSTTVVTGRVSMAYTFQLGPGPSGVRMLIARDPEQHDELIRNRLTQFHDN
ncbi:MAG: hypothetical protein NVS4B6_25610 [Mycobacterium sp.]